MAGEFNLIENFAVPFLSEWSKNNIGLLLDHEMNWNIIAQKWKKKQKIVFDFASMSKKF